MIASFCLMLLKKFPNLSSSSLPEMPTAIGTHDEKYEIFLYLSVQKTGHHRIYAFFSRTGCGRKDCDNFQKVVEWSSWSPSQSFSDVEEEYTGSLLCLFPNRPARDWPIWLYRCVSMSPSPRIPPIFTAKPSTISVRSSSDFLRSSTSLRGTTSDISWYQLDGVWLNFQSIWDRSIQQ